MFPDVAGKVDSGTKSCVAFRVLKNNNNRRACFRSTEFVEQSLFFRLAYPGLFIGLSSLSVQASRLS